MSDADQVRTAFVFPGLNGAGHAAEHLPLLAMAGFAARWQLVRHSFGATPGFATFDHALHAGETLPAAPAVWPWRALAVTAMQLTAAEALEARGEHADWLCGYSIGDVARCCHAGVYTFADVVGFAHALPQLPANGGATAAVFSPSTNIADELAVLLAGAAVTVSRLSPRFLMFAGAVSAVRRALVRCRRPGVRMQQLAACPLHSALQRPLALLLAAGLARAALGPSRRRMFSTLLNRDIGDADELRHELATNVEAPVDFSATVHQLHRQHGVTRFVGHGPGRHAQRFVRHHGAGLHALSATELLAAQGATSATTVALPARTRHGTATMTRFVPGSSSRAS
jgi:acyl transferase domain-containing protein